MTRFRNIARNRRRAFTLIELLIVILVLAILMAVALPLYLAAVSDSQVKTCRSNMQTIANAEAAYKTSSATHVYTTTLSALNNNLGATPICPSGGTYTVSITGGTHVAPGTADAVSGELFISCTSAGHGSFVPGKDSQ